MAPRSRLGLPQRASARSSESPREHRRRQCVQIGLAGKSRIERRQPSSRLEQQRWRSASARGDKCCLCAQQRDTCTLQVAEGACLCDGEKAERVVGAPAWNFVCAAARARVRVATVRGSASAPSRKAAAAAGRPRLRLTRRALEFAGQLFVRHGRRLRAVPRAAIQVELRIGCVRQRAVSLALLVRLIAPYTAERTSGCRNTTAASNVNKPSACTARAAVSDPKLLRCTPQKPKVADRFCRSQEQQPPRAQRGRASRRAKLCSIPVDKGSAAGSPKPPASWAGVSPRGSSRSASGFPPVSATIRSSTDSSSRAARADSNSTLASRRPNGSTRSSGKRANPVPTSRVANASAILSASRRRATNASARADPPSSHCTSSTTHSSGLPLGSFGEEAENREPDKERTRRLSGAESEGDAERVTLKIGETLGELEDRRTELLQRRVVKLHLPLDAGSPNDAEILARLDRVLEQRGLADAGVSVHHKDGAASVPRGIQQPLEHRALALPAQQPPRVRTDDHPGSMSPRSGLRILGIRVTRRGGDDEFSAL